MTTLYTQLVQDMWFKTRNLSRTEMLMKAYEPPRQQRSTRSDSTAREKSISRITFEEEQYEREMASIRNFGHHWLRPIGVAKTMAQAEDEAREIHESYEEYEGEDGDFNQNDPDLLPAGVEGPIASPREETAQSEAEEQDLDQDIEEGASFDAGETSYTSSTAPITPVPIAAGLYTTINGQPVSNFFRDCICTNEP